MELLYDAYALELEEFGFPGHTEYPRRILVCGSRTWTDSGAVFSILNNLLQDPNVPDVTLIEGANPRGADNYASFWAHAAREHGKKPVYHLSYPADWNQYGKSAGPIRNQEMINDGKPDAIFAFTEKPWTPGTSDMIRRARKARIRAFVFSHRRPATADGALTLGHL